jgi:hypothetical protein
LTDVESSESLNFNGTHLKNVDLGSGQGAKRFESGVPPKAG